MPHEILRLSSDSYSGTWRSYILIRRGPKLRSMIPHCFPIFTRPITQSIVPTLNARTASILPSLYWIGFELASMPLVLHMRTRARIAGTSALILRLEWAGSVTWMYAWTWPYPTNRLSCACRPGSFSNSSITSSNWCGFVKGQIWGIRMNVPLHTMHPCVSHLHFAEPIHYGWSLGPLWSGSSPTSQLHQASTLIFAVEKFQALSNAWSKQWSWLFHFAWVGTDHAASGGQYNHLYR